jgi:hypothetical protein
LIDPPTLRTCDGPGKIAAGIAEGAEAGAETESGDARMELNTAAML